MASAPGETQEDALVGLIPQLVYDPPTLDDDTMRRVRQIVVPVFDRAGHLVLALTAYGRAKDMGLGELVAALLDTASAATRRIGGRQPGRPA